LFRCNVDIEDWGLNEYFWDEKCEKSYKTLSRNVSILLISLMIIIVVISFTVLIIHRNKKSKIVQKKEDDVESDGYEEIENTNTEYNDM
jgi:hypothetical protein